MGADHRWVRRAGTVVRLLWLVATLPALPGALGAQERVPVVGRGELTFFARAHLAMDEARDAFHAEIAAAHEEQAIERAREAFDERMAEIFEEHDLTRERYGVILFQVSLDARLRATLDEILEELARERAEARG